MIVFGGMDNVSARLNDVWVLKNPNGLGGAAEWVELSPTGTAPAGRWLHNAVYDRDLDQMIVFGGETATDVCSSQVWILEYASNVSGTPNWLLLSPGGAAPAARSSFISAYADAANKLIVAGGNNCATPTPTYFTNSFVLGSGPAWTTLSPSGTPPVGSNGALYGASIYDDANDRLVVWGHKYDLNKLSILAGATGGSPSWSSMTLATQPTAEAYGPSAVYNPSTNRAVFFGGLNASNELWGLENANGLGTTPRWTEITAASPPDGRELHTAVYDSSNDIMIVFGGQDDGSLELGDVWILEDATAFPAAPTVTAISPSSGAAGDSFDVTLTGTNFVAGDTTVTISGTGVTAGAVSVNAAGTSATTTFTITSGAAAGSRGVTVATSFATSNSISFLVITDPPTLASVDPAIGTTGTVVAVTLTGTNFVGGETIVTISGTGVTAGAVSVNAAGTSATTNFTITAGAPTGLRDVTVTTPLGNDTATNSFTVGNAPTFTSITPEDGTIPSAVGVTLAGASFVAGQTTLTFSGTGVTSGVVSVGSGGTSATATVTIAAGVAAGTRTATIATPYGTDTSSFRVGYAPDVTQVTPASGTVGTDVEVTVSGSNFVAGETEVTVSGSGVSVGEVTVNGAGTSATATFTIAANAPAGARTVTLTTPFGSDTGAFTVGLVPTLSSITPNTGKPGTDVAVTLAGSNLTGASAVTISGTGVTYGSVSISSGGTALTTTFTVAADAAATARTVTVTTTYGTSNSKLFTVVSGPPTITSVDPGGGGVDSSVNVFITGTNFLAGHTSVTINGTGVTVGAVNITSPTSLIAVFDISSVAPAGARTVTVDNSFGTDTDTFTVATGGPTLTAITPNTGDARTPVAVTLAGTNLVAGQTTVSITGSGVTVGDVTVTSPTSLTTTFTISGGAEPGMRNVTASTPLGTSNIRGFRIANIMPAILSVTPAIGDATAPVTINVAGRNFVAGQTTITVSGSGVTAGSVTVSSGGTSATASITIHPNTVPGTRTLTITTPYGTSNGRAFRVASLVPRLLTLSPAIGSTSAPVPVTLTGVNFVPGSTTVTVSGTGVTAGAVSVSSGGTSATTTLTISSGAPLGSRALTVTTTYGTSNSRTFRVMSAAPTLASISPSIGVAGPAFNVTLTGTNLTGATAVTITGTGISHGTLNVNEAGTELTTTFTIAAGASYLSRRVTVTTPYGTTPARTFTPISLPPTLSSIGPNSGLVGTIANVVLSGSNFIAGQTTVAISGSDVTVGAVTVTSPTSITTSFTIGASAASGGRSVTVTTPLGTSVARTFTVAVAPPTLTSIAPNTGVQDSIVVVTLTGTNFTNGSTTVNVSGGGITKGAVNYTSPTSISIQLTIGPSAAVGNRTVSVTTPYGITSTRQFTVTAPIP